MKYEIWNIFKPQPAEFERLAHGDAVEDVEIGALDPDREKGERLGLFAGANNLGRAPPIVCRLAVADQKDPGAVVRDAVLAVSRLAVADDLDSLLDRQPHRRVALGG